MKLVTPGSSTSEKVPMSRATCLFQPIKMIDYVYLFGPAELI
jgi:hypothetical protein